MSEEEKKHDTSQPILIVIRRGYKDRGFVVSPVDNLNAMVPCQNEGEMAEVIVEMLNDEEQPRIDLTELIQATAESDSKAVERSDDDDDESEGDSDEEGEDEDEEESKWFEIDPDGGDPADQLIVNALGAILNRARKASRPSSGRGRRRGRRRRKRK